MSSQPVDFADVKIAGRRAQAARTSIAELARRDPAVFAQYVLRDERSGRPVKLAPMHVAWHDLLNQHDRVVLWSHVEAGKTTQISIARVLWEIGREPALRVLVLSNTHRQAAKIVRNIATYIEESAALHEVFPDLLPTQRLAEQWAPGNAITVRRPHGLKDPTVTASGVHGNVLGARFDLVILDDVLDWENTRTADGRKELIDWLQATITGRITRLGRMVVIGTAFHPDDALHYYAQLFSTSEQRAFRYPVVSADGTPRWPEQWSAARIEKRRQEMPPAEFARQMLCESRDDGEARFKREWIDIAVNRGRDKELCYALRSVPRGCMTFTGVDLAVQQHASADLTVLFTIIVHPNGDREVLDIQAGRWTGPDILSRIVDTHHRYQSIVMVENNAAQEFILQFARHVSAVPVRPYTTGRAKAHPEFGVESLATEMMNGKWIIPNKGGIAPEVQAWIQEMLYYDPKSHTGDRLMASFLSREAARQGIPKAEVGRLDLLSR